MNKFMLLSLMDYLDEAKCEQKLVYARRGLNFDEVHYIVKVDDSNIFRPADIVTKIVRPYGDLDIRFLFGVEHAHDYSPCEINSKHYFDKYSQRFE